MATKIERRRATVTLYQGDVEQQLADLRNQALAAERVESAGQRRHGTKSESIALAKAHDDLLAGAEESAVKLTVWAISYLEWGPLADDHPPRQDVAVKDQGVAAESFPDDKQRGVNMKTFPPALLRASLVEPGVATDLADLLAKGEVVLSGLDLSRVHYVKLERAAWNVNVGDDALPKFSLVSLLKQQRDLDSKQRNDSE